MALLSAQQVATLLNLPSKKAVYAMVEKGKLPSVKIGRPLRFDPTALQELIEAGTRPAAAGPTMPKILKIEVTP